MTRLTQHTKYYQVSLFLLTLLMSSCGFNLRGNYLLPENLQTLYVNSTDVHGELTRLVKRHLAVNQVNLLSAYQTDQPELYILKDKLDRRTLSVFPNGQVAEYELIYSVEYQLRLPEQAPKTLRFELYRDYQDDPDSALAKSRELSLLLTEMRREAADKILRDMASIKVAQ